MLDMSNIMENSLTGKNIFDKLEMAIVYNILM